MNPDFLDAHDRHWNDAEYLFAALRWANADHLYGLSAECGLKRLMIAFGMPVTTSGNPQRRQAPPCRRQKEPLRGSSVK